MVVTELTTRMAKLGLNIICYNRRGHHVSGKEYNTGISNKFDGINIKTVPTINKKGLAVMSSSFFAAIFTAFGKYDVVHFHAEEPCAMLWLPKLLGKRCIHELVNIIVDTKNMFPIGDNLVLKRISTLNKKHCYRVKKSIMKG
ncbi:MAG: hypothetical protein ACLUVC_03645 [Longibaculum sp.]